MTRGGGRSNARRTADDQFGDTETPSLPLAIFFLDTKSNVTVGARALLLCYVARRLCQLV